MNIMDVTLHNLKFFETPPWILLCVGVTGVLLALITEEDNFHVFSHDFCETAKYTKQKSHVFTIEHFWLQLKALLNFKKKKDICSKICNSILNFMNFVKSKITTVWTLYSLKKIATSKRHIFYLYQKKTLSLTIQKNESEIDSYLDCKKAMGENWPFMWEVSDVKEDKINCQGSICYPMSSYSYLNLIRDKRVQAAAIETAKIWSTGNHGPRMLGGNMSVLMELEKTVAAFYSRESTILCASGFLACMSICAAIATDNTVIFADSRLHSSLRSGLTIGRGKVFWFKHNNFDHCESLINTYRKCRKDSWMIVESVYSMDGDVCNLPKAHTLCQKYDIKLLIDEAHGLGVLGKTGRGIEEHYGIPNCATIIAGTFSKSIASIGGFITGPKKIIDYLDFHAIGNVFSAPLPAYCAGAAIKSFEIINSEPDIIEKTQSISKKFRRYLETGLNLWPQDYPVHKKYFLGGDELTTVIPLIFENDIDRVMRIASKLRLRGFMVSAVAYPACPLSSPRFRITATAALTDSLMRDFVANLVSTCIEEEPSTILNSC